MKLGYKQTEIGEIPEDWVIVSLGEIASVKTGPFGSALHAEDYVQSGTPMITVEHLGESCISRQNLPLISDEDKRRLSAYELQTGDIVFSRVGSVDRNAYVTEAENGWLFSGRLLRIRVLDTRCIPKYLSFYFKDARIKSKVREIAVGQTMPSLNTKLLLGFSVCLPQLPHQQRIAEALSDMDELIASLEKLIAKKKAIKQGAMQDLLTGKRRLPGFSGEWKKQLFGDLFEICPNNAYTRDQLTIGGKIKNIHYGDILTKYGAYLDGSIASIPTLEKTLEKKQYAEKAFVQDGDIIIADTAEDLTVGKAVEIVNVSGKILSGQHTFLCRPIIPFAPMYLGYYLNSADFHDQVVPYVTGTKVSSINKSSLCSLTVRFPSIPEQTAIAEILSNIDKDILAIEERLAKASLIKHGMMQQLLTGKIRIV